MLRGIGRVRTNTIAEGITKKSDQTRNVWQQGRKLVRLSSILCMVVSEDNEIRKSRPGKRRKLD